MLLVMWLCDGACSCAGELYWRSSANEGHISVHVRVENGHSNVDAHVARSGQEDGNMSMHTRTSALERSRTAVGRGSHANADADLRSERTAQLDQVKRFSLAGPWEIGRAAMSCHIALDTVEPGNV